MAMFAARSVRDRDVEWVATEDSDWREDLGEAPEAPEAVGTTRLYRVAALGSFATVLALCVVGSGRASGSRAGAQLASSVSFSDQGMMDVARANSVAAQELAAPNHLAVAPKENMNDGNVCSDDEEEYMGLCYGKCSQLAGPDFPVRTSAWTCCKQAACPPLSMFSCCRHNMGFCSGFDIAGKLEGEDICPHKPGACLQDEELFLDLCYMRCSLLTAGAYPYRTGPATCCKKKDASCMFEDGVKDGINGNAITNATLDVGGGCNDDKKLTRCKPHEPQVSLTEA